MTDSAASPSPTRSCSAPHWTSLERPLALPASTTSEAAPSRRRSTAGPRRSRCRSRPSRRRAASATGAFIRAAGTSATSSCCPTAAARSCTSARSTTRPGSGSTATWRSTHEGGHTPFSADITGAARPVGPADGDRAWSRTTRTTSPSRAASRTGSSSRTRSGIRARPASGRRSGWSASAAPTSTRSAGRRTSRRYAIGFEARIGGDPVDDLSSR